jgi:hypothetical protein
VIHAYYGDWCDGNVFDESEGELVARYLSLSPENRANVLKQADKCIDQFTSREPWCCDLYDEGKSRYSYHLAVAVPKVLNDIAPALVEWAEARMKGE